MHDAGGMAITRRKPKAGAYSSRKTDWQTPANRDEMRLGKD